LVYVPGIPEDPIWTNDVSTTPAYATTRVLASYDRSFTPNITAGLRAGLAFGGAPKEFFPYHAEVRGTFWIVSLAKKSLRPYVTVAGGMAQVDAPAPDIYIMRKTEEAPDGVYDANPDGSTKAYTAYKRMGQGFAAVAFGAVLPVGSMYGVQGNINAMYMLPSAGLVLEPSLGFLVGF
jgi:hypothetical protein